jgi:glycosyltransferase involved in cell wall biosynthesis
MAQKQSRIVMVGAFPPPLHGMAAINAAVFAALSKAAGAEPTIIDVAASGLNRSISARLGRLPKVFYGLARLASLPIHHDCRLYMSLSGGWGQIYEIAFALIARLRGLHLFLHHHSFAYLDARNWRTAWLVRVAGADAVHLTQSPRMSGQLKRLYGVTVTVPISNTVFLLQHRSASSKPRRRLQKVGFISNIAAEKGVFDFLDLLAAMQETGLSIRAKLAGPFQDAETEGSVRARLASLPNVQYVGPKHGEHKDAFFAEIDVLVFPTRYANETEGIVNHEAMSRGIPVIAYGRGCIPEIISADCGKVVDPADPFVPEALEQIKAWLDDPSAFEAASLNAARRFAETYVQSIQRWNTLLNDLACGMDSDAKATTNEANKPCPKT